MVLGGPEESSSPRRPSCRLLHNQTHLDEDGFDQRADAVTHDQVLRQGTFYSVGGGFVVDEAAVGTNRVVVDTTQVRYPFASAAELLEACERERLRVSDVMLANELSWRSEADLRTGLLHLWNVMTACVERG